MFVVIAGYGNIQVVRERQPVAQDVLEVLGGDVIQFRHAVAPVGVLLKIRIGQSQVALFRILVCILEFEIQLVPGTGRRITQFERIVLQPEPGITTIVIQVLETVRAPLMRFHQEPDTVSGLAPVMGMDPVRGILTAFRHNHTLQFIRDRCGNHIQRSADGVGSLGDRSRTLQHLECIHATRGGKVIGGRRGIGRRRNQHVVFQEGDAAAALRGNAADTDIGPQAVTIFHLYRDTRYLAPDTLDIGIGEFLQILLADEVCRTGNALGLGLAADNGDLLIDFMVGGVCRGIKGSQCQARKQARNNLHAPCVMKLAALFRLRQTGYNPHENSPYGY